MNRLRRITSLPGAMDSKRNVQYLHGLSEAVSEPDQCPAPSSARGQVCEKPSLPISSSENSTDFPIHVQGEGRASDASIHRLPGTISERTVTKGVIGNGTGGLNRLDYSTIFLLGSSRKLQAVRHDHRLNGA